MKQWLFIVLGLMSLNVSAVDVTNGPLQQDSSLCSYGYNSNCGQQSSTSRKVERIVVDVPSKYGAWAINRNTGIGGGHLNAASKAEAKREAIKYCENGGKNAPCKVVTWVRNGCIAGAAGKRKAQFESFYVADEKGLTESKALARCQASGASECKIIISEGCALP